MNIFTRQKQIHRLREWTYGYQGGRVGEGIVRELEINMYTLLYSKWTTRKDLQGTLLNAMWRPGWEGSLWENGYILYISLKRKMWYKHNGILLIKNNGILPFAATWMDLDIIIPSEASQTKTNIWYHLYVNLKYDTNDSIYKTERDTQT